jgi:diguanylate cyclase (GGDEF)-like protein
VIVIVESTRQNAEELGRRIQRSWQEVEIYDEEKGPIKVTFSVGITSVLPEDESLLDCIRRADQALYTAKSAGGNQTVIA